VIKVESDKFYVLL